MTSFRRPALVLVLVGVCAGRGPADARAERDHDVGVYFDPGGTARSLDVRSLFLFDVYVIAWNLHLPSKTDPTVLGFELAVEVDPRIIVVDRQALPFVADADPVDSAAGDDDWIVKSARCLDGFGAVRLLRYLVLLAEDADDAMLCVRPPDSSSSAPTPPAWLRCDEILVPLTLSESSRSAVPDGCGVVNPRPVATRERSWSSVKATFTNR